MRFRVVAAEAWRSLTASLSTSIAAAMTVLIGMFLVGLLIAFWTFADSWSNQQKHKLVVKVFMCTDQECGQNATAAQINAVRVKIASDPRVKSFRFVSKADALDIMRKTRPAEVNSLPFNPFPDSFTIQPIRGEDTRAIAESLTPGTGGIGPSDSSGVQNVNYGAKTASTILNVARWIKGIFLIAGLILIVASALLIANTIRLSIFARRREIEVMKLVGASNWFVRGPFVLEGIATGLLGSVAAVVLLLLGKTLALPQILPHVNAGSGVQAWPFPVMAGIVVLLGLALGATGSAVTLRRFLQV